MNFNKFFLSAMAVSLSATIIGEETAVDKTDPAIEEIVVIGHPLSGEGLAQPFTILASEELDRKAVDSIGATVGSEPGIHNSSFGVVAGRPVIHGLGGARVRVLEDRIDTMDVSVTSGDHAVTLDPFIADRVEIVKGSGTLLYGSGAIGGVVDVHTGRIPHKVQDDISGKLDLRAGNNGDGRNGSFHLDGGSGNFAWHFDSTARDADDYAVPGFIESVRLRTLEAEALNVATDEEDHYGEEDNQPHGIVSGSSFEVLGGSVGFSFVGERGFVGISNARLGSEYGIPGHSHVEHGHGEEEDHEEEGEEEHGEEGTPFIDLEQTRIDFEAGLSDPLPGFSSLNLRLGVNDYMHQELESSGEVGTAFENNAWEARAELSHSVWAGWTGVIGVQFGDRAFSVAGEEAFTPPVDTRSLGLFWVGERSFPGFQLEMGARLDSVEHDPATGDRDSFSGVSTSIGAIMPLDEVWEAAFLVDYSTRGPVGEELYSNGPHLATQSFEIGDSSLNEEKAINLSATLDGQGKHWSLYGTIYYINFTDFIYQMTTDEVLDDLVVRQFSQSDATFAGLDLEATVTIANWEGGQLEVNGFFDTVSGTLDVTGNDNLPHIPPRRAGLGLALTSGQFNFNLDYIRAFKQTDVANLELETDAYNDLRAYLGWETVQGRTMVNFFLQGRNLTDAEQRQHTSIIKDLVPEPGRTIEAGVRVSF